MVSLPENALLYFNLETAILEGPLAPTSHYKFTHEISAICLSEKSCLLYVALWDAPNYTFCVFDLKTLKILALHSTSSFVEQEAYKQFL